MRKYALFRSAYLPVLQKESKSDKDLVAEAAGGIPVPQVWRYLEYFPVAADICPGNAGNICRRGHVLFS